MMLEEPFASEYSKGYLATMKDGRKAITMYKWLGDGKKKMERMLYSRYLMSVKLGRRLLPSETVDHIDDDKANDSIDNLQILSLGENQKKYFAKVKRERVHGTDSMYRSGGCRCEDCTAAHKAAVKEFNRQYRIKHADQIAAYKKQWNASRKQISE